MQIAVFGANGKVGSLVVQEILKKNLKVVAFVHGRTNLVEGKNLKIIRGDIHNYYDVDRTINDADIVVSALGSWGTSSKDILTTGIKNIILSMNKHKIKRVISLTGADVSIESDNLGIISRLSKLLIRLFAKKVFQDGENHVQLLVDSNLDWTVVRSPVMNERGNSNDYSLTDIKPAPWSTINRSSVATAMVELLNDQNFIKQAPYIKRTKR